MDNELRLNTLFLALTRPAMTYGVTHEYFMVNAMLSLCLFLLAGNFFYLLTAIPVHIVGVLAHRVDNRFLKILTVRAKFPKARHFKHWGVQSYAAY